MTNLDILKEKVLERIKDLEDIVLTNWGEDNIPSFDIKYILDSKNRVGLVRFNHKTGEKFMELNPELLENYTDLYIKEIVSHEYAHLVVATMFPTGYNGRSVIKPHGKEFKAISSWFGIDGKSTTSLFKEYFVKKVNKNIHKWEYRCGCEHPHMLTTRTHNNIQQNNRKYNCKACGESLIYIG